METPPLEVVFNLITPKCRRIQYIRPYKEASKVIIKKSNYQNKILKTQRYYSNLNFTKNFKESQGIGSVGRVLDHQCDFPLPFLKHP